MIKRTQPPRWASRLLEWFCADHLLEEIRGDLEERFQKNAALFGERSAKREYVANVLGFMRPFAWKEKSSTPLYTQIMISNYFKIAFRNLVKHKGYSSINIVGLATGMTVAILIGLWIYDELSYDKYHKNYDRVAQLLQYQTSNGNEFAEVAMPFPLGPELKNKYGSHFKYLSMATWTGDNILSFGDKKMNKKGNFMEPDFPKLASLKMIHGSEDGLKEQNSILLSESTAKALFGETDPVNQLMKINNKLDVRVTGVYEDLPYNTEFRELEFISTWALFVSSEPWVQRARDQNQWGNNSFQIFAQIADNTDFETVNKAILNAKLNNVADDEKKYKAKIQLHPMSEWHLRSNWENGVQTGGAIEYVWLFGVVGVFVLILACINFMNLSTARSEKRAKEVGIRKAIGSVRGQLISQFFSESLLVVLIAFALSLVMVQLSLSWFNEVADKKIEILWTNPFFWIAGIGFSLFTGLIAGSYPALYLSSFQPVKVLKGTFKAGRFASMPRKALVVLQFTVSVTLIIGTIIVYRQIQHSKNRPVGYNRDGLVMIQMSSPDFYGKFDLLRNELKSSGAVEEMVECSSPLTGVWSNSGGFQWQGKDPELDADFATVWVTHDFGKTVGWEFKEGRDFSRDFSTDTSAIVLNEAAVRFMGIKDPVGQTVKWGSDKDAPSFKIVGVIRDMLMDSPYEPVKQAVYMLSPHNVNWIVLKLNPAKSASESLAGAEKVFKKLIPAAPFDYKFASTEFASKFDAEVRIGKLASVFAGLAIFISCLGLFGLASFVAEQRTKEIGVRKVLGASVFNLWKLLSKDFVMLVLISLFIAIPVAWYFMNDWLQKYDYRTDISWWIFAVAGVGSLFITLLTVSYQAIKAALMNPVKTLKSE